MQLHQTYGVKKHFELRDFIIRSLLTFPYVHNLIIDIGNVKKHNSSLGTSSSTAANGNVLQYENDDVVIVEPVEKTKGIF